MSLSMVDTSSSKTNNNKASMAAYTYFVKLIRDEHRKKHPDEHFDFAEFSAKCAEKWKSMKPEERKRFEELAAEEGEKKPRKKRTRKRQKKAPGQPKRAWSAFFYFCDERRPKVRKEHPEWRVAEVARELGRMWEACSDRDKYEKMAVLDKERYEKEMEQFRAGNFVAGETKRPKLCDNQEESDHEEEEDEEDELEGSSSTRNDSSIGQYDVNDVEKMMTCQQSQQIIPQTSSLQPPSQQDALQQSSTTVVMKSNNASSSSCSMVNVVAPTNPILVSGNNSNIVVPISGGNVLVSTDNNNITAVGDPFTQPRGVLSDSIEDNTTLNTTKNEATITPGDGGGSIVE